MYGFDCITSFLISVSPEMSRRSILSVLIEAALQANVVVSGDQGSTFALLVRQALLLRLVDRTAKPDTIVR